MSESHEHRYAGQTLRHTHAGGDQHHGYYEHPEDGGQPSHLWPCGCLKNEAGAHRVGCPDHPEGVRGS
jgi:hypothetical protein